MKKICILTLTAAIMLLIPSCRREGSFVIQEKDKAGFIEADNLNIQYYGRWDFSDRKEPRADWGPVYIRIKFQGSSCRLVMNDNSIDLKDLGNGNFYQYSIDGGPFTKIPATSKNIYTLAEKLPDAEHSVLFARRSESKWGTTEVGGFILDAGKTLTDPGLRPKRKIEIVGDSILAGLADEDTSWYTNATEDGYMAWGPQLARLCDAEWNVEAKGGGYFVQPGYKPDEFCMQRFFTRAVQKEENSRWNFSSWKPDVFILALGTNDFTDTSVADKRDFEKQYSDFVKMVRGYYPDAEIFCLGPFKQGKPWDMCRQYIAEAVKATGDSRAHAIDPVGDGADLWLSAPFDYVNGDPYHPNIKGDTKIAARMYNIIKPVLGW